MKKIKLSVAALLIAGTSYGQTMKECCVKTAQDVYEYEGLTMDSTIPMKNGVYLTKHEVWNMIGDLEDILEWQQQDIEEGNTSCGSYEEGWGSNYWLTLMLEKLEEIASRNAENWR